MLRSFNESQGDWLRRNPFSNCLFCSSLLSLPIWPCFLEPNDNPSQSLFGIQRYTLLDFLEDLIFANFATWTISKNIFYANISPHGERGNIRPFPITFYSKSQNFVPPKMTKYWARKDKVLYSIQQYNKVCTLIVIIHDWGKKKWGKRQTVNSPQVVFAQNQSSITGHKQFFSIVTPS